MRIASNSLSGGGGDEITVIRGSLGTNTLIHPINSRIKKVKPLPIELRRPSILRSSGHTFEYVGFGPGNYSTALPQLQNRSLTEREEFLNQAQETSCGNVVYTGMNDKGDFYIGNTKIESASGQQKTFDIPVPTVTGEDPNRLSLVADEVIVKERLLVEGGSSKQILSQFDGPVTFNSDVRLSNDQKQITIEPEIRARDANFKDTENATSTTTGAVTVEGGVGIAKSDYIGGDLIGSNTGFSGVPDILGIGSITATAYYGDGAGLTNTGANLTEATTGSERVVLTDITSGTMTAAKTDSDLTFNFATNTLSSVNFAGSLIGNADTTTLATNVVGGANHVPFNTATDTTSTTSNFTFTTSGSFASSNQLKVIGELVVDSVRIGSVDGTTIDTTSGDLKLSSINDKVVVSPQTASTSKDTGALVVNGGLGVAGKIHAGNDIVAFNASDITLKENINPIPNSLDKILSLSGNIFSWNSKSDYYGTDDIGILAQEVEALGLPGITQTRDNGVKAVRYDRLIPLSLIHI